VDWHSIDWKKAHKIVDRLQASIVQATKAGKRNKVKALQRILTHSFSGKALAVKRVTENQGKNTPGVDKILWNTPEKKAMAVQELQSRGYTAQPLRRMYLPKPNGKQRPLGIPMCPAYCISCARVLGIVIAEPACLSQLPWAQTVLRLTATSEWPHCFCLKANGRFLLTHPGYSTPRVPPFSLLTEASKD